MALAYHRKRRKIEAKRRETKEISTQRITRNASFFFSFFVFRFSEMYMKRMKFIIYSNLIGGKMEMLCSACVIALAYHSDSSSSGSGSTGMQWIKNMCIKGNNTTQCLEHISFGISCTALSVRPLFFRSRCPQIHVHIESFVLFALISFHFSLSAFERCKRRICVAEKRRPKPNGSQ